MDKWKKKARLVAQGNREISAESWTLENHGDYWTPVASLHTLRLVAHYAASAGYDLATADVESAYLQGEITGPPIFIVLPSAMDPTGLPRRMHRPLYGLRRAGYSWWSTCHQSLEKLGWQSSPNVKALYYKTVRGKKIFLLTYVDDLSFAGPEAAAFWKNFT